MTSQLKQAAAHLATPEEREQLFYFNRAHNVYNINFKRFMKAFKATMKASASRDDLRKQERIGVGSISAKQLDTSYLL